MTNTNKDVPYIPVSWGELIDKVTILEIKSKNLLKADRLANVKNELYALEEFSIFIIKNIPELATAKSALYETNQRLWHIEDAVRQKESEGDFGLEFVELARMVYKTNDQRAKIKREINQLTGSVFFEEKSYKHYTDF